MRACEIAKLLANDVLRLCSELYPNGNKSGNEYEVGGIEGEQGKSLKIRLTGAKAGIWKDFAGDVEDSGDLIGLIMRCKKLDLCAACKYGLEFLGIDEERDKIRTTPRKSYTKPIARPNPTFNDKVLHYLTQERKLLPEALNAFKVYSKGTKYCLPSYVQGELVRIKAIALERDERGKKKIETSVDSEPCLFGWQTYKGIEREVIICEGELDCITWHQYGYFALSIPTGAEGMTWIEIEWERLSNFDTVYISYDLDKKAQIAASNAIQRLGNDRCKLVKLPYKDINECLQKGCTQEEVERFIIEAKCLDPEELKDCMEFKEKTHNIIHPVNDREEGLELGFHKSKGKILLRPHELSLWTGITGHGKSLLLGQIVLAAFEIEKCLIASFEMKPERTLSRMSKQYTDQWKPTAEMITKTFTGWSGKIYIYDIYGQAETTKLLNTMEYSFKRYGISFFVIDSLMMLNIFGDDYNGQAVFIKKLLEFKEKFKVHINLVVHPRKRSTEFEAIGKLDIKGSGDISNLADNIFSVHRNKTKEQLKQKEELGTLTPPETLKFQESRLHGDVLLKCEKQRHGNWEGEIELWLNPSTGRYRDTIVSI